MRIEESVSIVAPRERIWNVLTDVELWNEWTPSITEIRRLDGAPFGPGSRVRIRQPRLPDAVWQVTDFQAAKGFVWESHSPGIHSSAEHWIGEAAGSEYVVTLKLQLTGLLSALLSPLISGLARRYVHMEAAGLRKRCEQ